MQTVLAKIVADKTLWLEARKAQQPLASFQHEITTSDRNFYRALKSSRTAFILECKKASPSKGVIRDDFDLAYIAQVYRRYASVVSVLTDEKYFQGSFDFLSIVSGIVSQPVLCKDFIIDPYQIYLARHYQADACLLMLSVLDDEQYCQLEVVAHSLDMGVLTEVSNEEELARAIALNARVVGINNRDLRDLSIDLSRTRQLAPRLPHSVITICESGINTYAQVRELSRFANGFLIGSALMSESDLTLAVRRVLLGENKVCGLTQAQDASAAWEAGAIYGGLIFVPSSPRVVSEPQAREIIQAAPLRYVGVFRNQPIRDIIHLATTLNLSVIQLHGDETQTDITTLRATLPERVKIWKAFSVGNQIPERNLDHVDRYVLDNGKGGTGKRFDWSLLARHPLDNVMLAGGLNADNCVQAATLGCAGLDINSGVESAPGIKDANKLAALFQTLRDY